MNAKLNNWFLLPLEIDVSKIGVFNEFYNADTYFIFNYLLIDCNKTIYTSGYCGCEYEVDPYDNHNVQYDEKPMLGHLQDIKIGSGTINGYFDETDELIEYRIDTRHSAINAPDGRFDDWSDKTFNNFYDGSGCTFGCGDERGRN